MKELKKRFKQAIACGIGEAYLILHDNPNLDFSSDIINACINNLSYDGQCEGDRAAYLANIIRIAKNKDKIIESILAALLTEQKDTWALEQLFELAAIFFIEGNIKAKKAIYKRYYKKIIEGSAWCGERALLKVDGIKGLIYIAKQKGKYLIKNQNEWEDSYLVDQFQVDNPQIKVYQELTKASKDNRYIKKYLSIIKTHRWKPPESLSREKYTYEKVKENINKLRPRPITPIAVKELTIKDVKRLADDFQKESDPRKQEKYLQVFSKIKYPFDYAHILQFAKKKNTQKNRLVEFACKALSYFRADDIRRLALEKITTLKNPSNYLSLLISNYKKGDYIQLKNVLARNNNFEIIHSMVWDYIDIYTKNRTIECREPLEMLYRKLNCGIHRYDIIRILYESKNLSKTIISELEYDSYDYNREYYDKKLKDRK